MTKKCKRTAIGLVTGFANGLFGSGGGTIVVPAMERFLGEEEHKAHATAIAVILPLSLLSLGVYLWKADLGAVWRIALWASAGGLVGGFVGAKLLQRVSGVWLHRIFIHACGGSEVNLMMWGVAAIGFFSGIISGMGIGGGTILIPALLFLTEVNQQQAQGVNLIYFIPTAVVALITHHKNGTLDLKTAKPLALLGLAGAAAGAFLAVSLESEILKKLFGGFLLLMGLSEIFKKKKGEDTHAKG